MSRFYYSTTWFGPIHLHTCVDAPDINNGSYIFVFLKNTQIQALNKQEHIILPYSLFMDC